jgi:hypothetical protein
MPDVTDDPVPTRRRRRRAVWRAGAGISRSDNDDAAEVVDASPPEAVTAATPQVDNAAAEPKPPTKRRRSEPSERGLRDLVGAGPSQLGPVRAMRARDANRPTAADLAEAEQDLAIVRRHWKPPTT